MTHGSIAQTKPEVNHPVGVDGYSAAEPDSFTEPHHSFTLAERDVRLSTQARIIRAALFESLKAHAFGEMDHLRIEDLPEASRTRLHEMAIATVQRVGGATQEQAIRRTTIHARHWLESYVHSPLALAEIEGSAIFRLCRRILTNFIDLLLPVEAPTLVTEILTTYEHELTQPCLMGERGQRFKAAWQRQMDGAR